MKAIAALLLCAGAPALAQSAPPGAPAGAAAPAEAVKPAADDFELLAPEARPSAERQAEEVRLQRELSTRRSLLQIHQIGGLATVASVGAAVVFGQLNYADKYGGGGDTGKWMTAHRVAAYGSAGIFAATGLAALLAPSPFENPLRLDSATLHKTAMVVATAGMASQIVLGILAKSKEGQISQRDLALAHQVSGYVTLAAVTSGFAVFFF